MPRRLLILPAARAQLYAWSASKTDHLAYTTARSLLAMIERDPDCGISIRQLQVISPDTQPEVASISRLLMNAIRGLGFDDAYIAYSRLSSPKVAPPLIVILYYRPGHIDQCSRVVHLSLVTR